MDRERQLIVGARTADALVMVVGLAGVGAGGLLLARDEPIEAVLAWALTFVAGAALRLLGTIARALAEVLSQVRATSQRLERRSRAEAAEPLPEDRWGSDDRWGRLH